jgi:AraC-like DNA-binding protein
MLESIAAPTRSGEPQPRVLVGYGEHAPPADLANDVQCFWTDLAPEAAPSRPAVRRVLPDGCVDIIIAFGTPVESRDASARALDAMAVGAMTRPLVITGPAPRLYVGARFLPGRALAALGIPAAELLDERLAYADLEGASSADLSVLVAGETPDTPFDKLVDARLDAVASLVRKRLVGTAATPRAVRAAVRRISIANGNLRVATLASDIGVTRQQLARLFATHVGVTPKTFARVMRAQAVLARADAARAAYPRDIDWSAIACDLGYYDQPHFIDDFKALTGLTPAKWLG